MTPYRFHDKALPIFFGLLSLLPSCHRKNEPPQPLSPQLPMACPASRIPLPPLGQNSANSALGQLLMARQSRVKGLEPGIYRYECEEHASSLYRAALSQQPVAEAAAIIVILGVYERTAQVSVKQILGTAAAPIYLIPVGRQRT